MRTELVARERPGCRCAVFAACVLLALLATVQAHASATPDWTDGAASARRIVVTVADRPDPAPAVGATPRGYAGLVDYSGGERAVATAARLARDHGLREVSSWPIDLLRVRCLVFELPDDVGRDEVIARLAQDRRVRLVQPLQAFETLTASSTPDVPAYNDPYVGLQHAFSTIEGAAAQRWSRGDGVRVAIIDAGVDGEHPDLAGRIAVQRDFVEPTRSTPRAERHGTEVAGAMAASANNHVGIVGVAPEARLHAYRACWTTTAGRAGCNSFTLALALGAAIAADVRVINLSLGGPRDPLLEQLVDEALDRGIVVVGAVPPDGSMAGFPLAIRGVVAVTVAGEHPPPDGVLAAPGRDILTLQPGGSFDYASGSSLAAAQVSGAVALLVSLRPRLDRSALVALLARSRGIDGVISACRAIVAMRGASDDCAEGHVPVALADRRVPAVVR